jgi:poly(hydroxyalkanoate) granule-associated protein
MAKKPPSEDEAGNGFSSPFADTVKESAQQIWLAGLGAFSKAQEEGGKVFEALVKEGVAMQRRTQEAAEGKLAEATSRMAAMASELSGRASAPWDKLGPMFEQQLARGLKQLGVPSARDLDALQQRVAELERQVASLHPPAGAPRRPARRTPARATGTRSTRPRKSAG